MYIYVRILCEENRYYMVKIRVFLLMISSYKMGQVSSLGPIYTYHKKELKELKGLKDVEGF